MCLNSSTQADNLTTRDSIQWRSSVTLTPLGQRVLTIDSPRRRGSPTAVALSNSVMTLNFMRSGHYAQITPGTVRADSRSTQVTLANSVMTLGLLRCRDSPTPTLAH